MAQEHGEKHSNNEVEQNEGMSSEAAAQAIASANQQAEMTEKAETIDDLLDAIDGVLEENAETFVGAFVQKGGQ